MKKLLFLLVAIPIQSWAMQSNTNRILAQSNAQSVIEIDSDSESSVEEVITNQQHVVQYTNNNNRNPAQFYSAPVLHATIARIQREDSPRLNMPRNAERSLSAPQTRVSTNGKEIIDQKLSQIDCCGLSLGNWARGLNHIMLTHKREQALFVCSKCNKLFDSASNALTCVAKHNDSSLFTCPNCMVDCVMYDAFLKHVCPVIKTPIKTEPTPLNYNQPIVRNYISPNSASTDNRLHYNSQSEALTPLSAMLAIPETTDSGYVSSPITNASFDANEIVEINAMVDGNQKKSQAFNPHKSVKKNVKILRNMIEKKLREKSYNCCSEKNLTWDSFCEHVRNVHAIEEGTIVCPLCVKELNGYTYGYDHIAWHTDPSLFSCPLSCTSAKSQRAYNDQRKCREHLVSHFRSCFAKKYNLRDQEELRCKCCNKYFSNTGNFNRHISMCYKKNQQAEKDISLSESEATPSMQNYGVEDTYHDHEISPSVTHTQTIINPVFENEHNQDFSHNSSPHVAIASDGARDFDWMDYNQDTTNLCANTNQIGQAHNQNNANRIPTTALRGKSHEKNNRDQQGNKNQSQTEQTTNQPVVLEGFVFNVEGNWDSNRVALNKLIAARLAKQSFNCCDHKNITWQAFCSHQKDHHRKKIGGTNKVVCPVCDKSYRAASITHEHSATHQHPTIFECPLCAHNEMTRNHENKESLVKHFRNCLDNKYYYAQNNKSTSSVENHYEQDITPVDENSSGGLESIINQSIDEFHEYSKS